MQQEQKQTDMQMQQSPQQSQQSQHTLPQRVVLRLTHRPSVRFSSPGPSTTTLTAEGVAAGDALIGIAASMSMLYSARYPSSALAAREYSCSAALREFTVCDRYVIATGGA